jgi:hypothetical protein
MPNWVLKIHSIAMILNAKSSTIKTLFQPHDLELGLIGYLLSSSLEFCFIIDSTDSCFTSSSLSTDVSDTEPNVSTI